MYSTNKSAIDNATLYAPQAPSRTVKQKNTRHSTSLHGWRATNTLTKGFGSDKHGTWWTEMAMQVTNPNKLEQRRSLTTTPGAGLPLVLAALAMLLVPCLPKSARASDTLLTGKKATLKFNVDVSRRSLKVTSKDERINLGAGPGSADDPRTVGANVRIMTSAGDVFAVSYSLPATRWTLIGKPDNPKGYKYKDSAREVSNVRKVIIKTDKFLKVGIRGESAFSLSTAPDPLNVSLTLGSRRLCTAFGGDVGFKPGSKYTAKNAETAWGCDPITPSVNFTDSTFQGFDVVSYIPPNPVAIAFVFHGTGGNARFARKINTVETLNELIERGYGFVSTESTDRLVNLKWDASDPSLVSNPDLARLAALHDDMIAQGLVQASTPLVGIGMSNGSRFVTLWGTAFANDGRPVAAITASMGRVAQPVLDQGGLAIPTVFVIAENDQVIDNAQVIQQFNNMLAAGVPTVFHETFETALTANRFLRVAGVDSPLSREICDAGVATGIWNTSGQRIVTLEQAATLIDTVVLPPAAIPMHNAIQAEAKVVLGLHQYTGSFSREIADFFDAHLP